MAVISGRIADRLLAKFSPREQTQEPAGNEPAEVNLRDVFGADAYDLIDGKIVIDFGCGAGNEVVDMARKGASRVIGLDLQLPLLSNARELALRHKVQDKCLFTTQTDEKADIITSKDAFEHFSNPEEVLQAMSKMLRPGGTILASFGPIWLHPHGGHLFSVFPWAHIVLSEKSLIKWRSKYRNDGATSFGEVEGGLNKMTIRRFERIVAASDLEFQSMDTVPIKGLPVFKSRLFREIGSSLVICRLQRRVGVS